MSMIKLMYLILGGISGTISRYVLSGVIYRLLGTNFPYGTFIVNILGCLVIGLLAGFSEKKFLLSEEMRLLLMVGFCGAFTTFSTFIFETDHLVRDGEMIKASLNIILSVFVGFILYRLGFFLAELI